MNGVVMNVTLYLIKTLADRETENNSGIIRVLFRINQKCIIQKPYLYKK